MKIWKQSALLLLFLIQINFVPCRAATIDSELVDYINDNISPDSDFAKVDSRYRPFLSYDAYYDYRYFLNHAADKASISSNYNWVPRVLSLKTEEASWARIQRQRMISFLGLDKTTHIESRIPRMNHLPIPRVSKEGYEITVFQPIEDDLSHEDCDLGALIKKP
jgi:hypothetical protein